MSELQMSEPTAFTERKPKKTEEINLWATWLECQRMLKNPKETAAGNFGTYAPLDKMLVQFLPTLHAHGFTLCQTTVSESGQPWMVTTLNHVSGKEISVRIPMYGDFKDMQKFGASITYARRYSLCMILGLEGEKDLDHLTEKTDAKTTTAAGEKIDPSWVIPFGKFKGKKIGDIKRDDLYSYIDFLMGTGKPLGDAALMIEQYLNETDDQSL